jgi:hypothetical protein
LSVGTIDDVQKDFCIGSERVSTVRQDEAEFSAGDPSCDKSSHGFLNISSLLPRKNTATVRDRLYCRADLYFGGCVLNLTGSTGSGEIPKNASITCRSRLAAEMRRLRASFWSPVRSALLRKKFVRVIAMLFSLLVRIRTAIPRHKYP